MGFWDRLLSRTAPADAAPPLQAQLFDAANAGDMQRVRELAMAHADAIRAGFEGWKKVPPELRSNPAKVQWYGTGLIAVAQCFAEQLNDGSLLQQLMGPPGSNPIERWQAAMVKVDTLIEGLSYAAAEAALSTELEAVSKLQGGHALSMQAMTLGRRGDCRFNTARPDEALSDFERAEDLCARGGDLEGRVTHLGNRVEALRWAGRHAEAAPIARALAALHRGAGRVEAAARLEARARLFERGEPLVRVVLELDGRLHELDALPLNAANGKVRAIFERNRLTLRPSQRLLEQGRSLGSAGDLRAARDCLSRAAVADVFDPAPHYEGAFTDLLLGDAAQAVEGYARAEVLAPGWFHVRGDLWLARECAAGRLHVDVARAVLTLESIGNLGERERAARALTQRVPMLPHAWLALSEAAPSAEAVKAAAERGLECAVEPDVRSRLLLKVATAGPTDRKLLEQVLSLEGNRVSQAWARLLLQA